MAKVTDGGQGKLDQKALSVPPDVLAAFEEYLEHKESAAAFNKAKTKIKEAIPEVAEATQFVIAERYLITATPYDADGHEVSGGRRQRLKIEAS